jgi:hypothetical protein
MGANADYIYNISTFAPPKNGHNSSKIHGMLCQKIAAAKSKIYTNGASYQAKCSTAYRRNSGNPAAGRLPAGLSKGFEKLQ